MSVENGVATIGLEYWSLFNADSYIPTFGLFGGPGYLGGHRFDDNNICIDDPSFTIQDAFNTPVAVNSLGVDSQSDIAYKVHDTAYYQADGQSNEAELVLLADLSLLQNIYAVFVMSGYYMDRKEIVYDLLAARLFEAKIMAYDLSMAGLEAIKNTAHNLLNTIITSSETYTIDHLTLPTNPETTNSILGNLKPVDFDPDTPGIQTQTDEWGNVIVTAEAEPGRNDTLFDTTADDRIEGLDGNDWIIVKNGGNNWILGGNGNDDIYAALSTGDDILEGGSGNDIIAGGSGDDEIFGDDYGEMETLIADGETAQGIDEKGDLASGVTGNDFVYGSNRNDALFGGDGHDLIVGGGGDEYLILRQQYRSLESVWLLS